MADDLLRLVSDERKKRLYDPGAEKAVLAAALLDAEGAARVIPRLMDLVTAADFYAPQNATLWEVFLALHGRGEAVDVLTVVAELRARDRLHTIGGAQYVGELTDEIPTLAHCEAHARIVRDLARRRRALDACQVASTKLFAGVPLEAVQAEMQHALAPAAESVGAARVGDDLDALYDTVIARKAGEEGPLATPWANLNGALRGGLWPGMYVLVGGTGAGKTQWAIQTSVEVATRGGRVLYLALELGRKDLGARIVGTVANVSWSDFLYGKLDESGMTRAIDAAPRVRALPLHTECGAPFGYGADTLAARAWSMRPSLVVLDYLQLCGGRAGEEMRTTVGRVSYVARSIARDLGAVVLVLSSTARANYAQLVSSEETDPADLVGMGKESGEIEYAADGVLVLARHADREAKPKTRVLVLAKNRHGPLGRVEFEWSGTSFCDAPGEEGVMFG
jgi:replicative DNA helicase